MVETNAETLISAGDFFDIPPGHDGYVQGDNQVELILVAPPEHGHWLSGLGVTATATFDRAPSQSPVGGTHQ